MTGLLSRIAAGVVIGGVAGALLSFLLSIQLGTVILMAGWSQRDVETLAAVQFVAGIGIGVIAGIIWAVRRRRKAARRAEPPPPKFGRGG